jgi:leucyl/phenylalanyl-tRNA--protein transferase
MRSADDTADLQPEAILEAYRQGLFPMAEHRWGPVRWYTADPRAIIPLDAFHRGRNLRRAIRRGKFAVTVNAAFEEVIRRCAEREETWISDAIIRAYTALHHLRHAHSVECWTEGVLVGGLYGVSLGGAFFGESMFSRRADASKVALAALVDRLRQRRFLLLDSQFMNEHMRQFGAIEIPRSAYLVLLRKAVSADTDFLGAA